MVASLALLPARIAPERIAFVKFILEGYDGLAILTTVDRTSGEVTFSHHPARRDELLGLLTELRVDLDRPLVQQPKTLL